MFDHLSQDLILSILLDYVDVDVYVLCLLDIAVCNHGCRSQLLSTLEVLKFCDEEEATMNCLEGYLWLASRKVQVTSILVDPRKIVDMDFTQLPQFPHITSLSIISDKPMSKCLVPFFKLFPCLRVLDTESCEEGVFADQHIVEIVKACPALRNFHLMPDYHADNSMDYLPYILKHCPTVEVVWVGRLKFSFPSTSTPHRRLCSVEWSDAMDDDIHSMVFVLRQCNVRLSGCSGHHCIGDHTLVLLTDVVDESISTLSLTLHNDVDNTTLAALLSKCPNLELLALEDDLGPYDDGTPLALSDVALAAIRNHCPRITDLSLTGFVKITDDGVERLLQSLAGNKMAGLAFPSCNKLTDSTLLKIAELFPDISSVNLACSGVDKATFVDLIMVGRLRCVNVWHHESDWIKAELEKQRCHSMPQLRQWIDVPGAAGVGDDDNDDDNDEEDEDGDETDESTTASNEAFLHQMMDEEAAADNGLCNGWLLLSLLTMRLNMTTIRACNSFSCCVTCFRHRSALSTVTMSNHVQPFAVFTRFGCSYDWIGCAQPVDKNEEISIAQNPSTRMRDIATETADTKSKRCAHAEIEVLLTN